LFTLRERELTARALGIDVARYKTLAFAYSSFLAGLAGALYAPLKGYISVDDFTIWNSIYFFVMIAVGGITSIAGGIIGAIVVTIMPEALRGLQEAANAVFGILLVLIIVFLPGGLVSIPSWLARFASPSTGDIKQP
jgi:branched-chain amino acid transport system permease protein